MKKYLDSVYKLAFKFMKYLSLFMSILLLVSAFIFTAYAEDMGTQKVIIRLDNILINILEIVAFSLIIYGICKWVSGDWQKRKKYLLCGVWLWYLLSGSVLVLFSKTVPAADAMSVFACAAELANGNMGVIHPTDSYLSFYPQQMGLISLYEIIIRIWNLFPISMPAYHIIKLVNVLFACIIIFFQYKCVQILFKSHIADTIYLLLSLFHFPLLVYTSFVYGEIPSFALFTIGTWALLHLLKEEMSKQQCWSYVIVSIAAFCGSVAFRKNTLILMIAVFIVTFFESLRRKNIKLFALAVLYVSLSVMTLPCIQSFYEYRAGNELSKGVTAMSYFAMGMQEGGRAAGWYNGFNFNTYQKNGLDASAANELSRQVIEERITEFIENPVYAGQFYGEKFLSQWADGTYACLQATLATFGGRISFFQEVYEGKYSGIFREYCNALQNIIYVGLLLFTVKTMKKKEAQGDLVKYLFMIGVVGGLLFHMIWEANSRYIFVYGLLLLPYAASGVEWILNGKKMNNR